MKKPFHTFLLAAYPILLLASLNLDEIDLGSPVIPLLLSLGYVALLVMVLGKLLKNLEKAAILTSLLTILFFSYGHLVGIKGDIKNKLGIGLSNDEILIYSLIVAGVLFLLAWRTRKNLEPVTVFLNVASIVLCVFPLITIAQYVTTLGGSDEDEVVSMATFKAIKELKVKPDVYFLLFDGYPRSDILKKNYGVSNQAFLEQLEKRGFSVGTKSCSNYPRTLLSLAATFHMTYLDGIAKKYGPQYRTHGPYVAMIRDNPTVRIFKTNGYSYVHLGSPYYATKFNYMADYNAGGPGNEFQDILLSSTLLMRLSNERMKYDSLRNHTVYTLKALETVGRYPSPKYVFAHVVSPHPPLFFNEKGEPLVSKKSRPPTDKPHKQRDISKYKKQLAQHMVYLDNEILKIVDGILKNSKTPPIIIIQGDHGTREMGGNFSYPFKPSLVDERVPILNVMYLPPDFPGKMPENMSAVNTFRLLFANLFGLPYPMLPNKHLMIESKFPMLFYDVTDQAVCK